MLRCREVRVLLVFAIAGVLCLSQVSLQSGKTEPSTVGGQVELSAAAAPAAQVARGKDDRHTGACLGNDGCQWLQGPLVIHVVRTQSGFVRSATPLDYSPVASRPPPIG